MATLVAASDREVRLSFVETPDNFVYGRLLSRISKHIEK